MFDSVLIPLLFSYIVAIPIAIVWGNLIHKDKTTQEERDNTPFP
jgi:hypothetical protein